MSFNILYFSLLKVNVLCRILEIEVNFIITYLNKKNTFQKLNEYQLLLTKNWYWSLRQDWAKNQETRAPFSV